MCAGGAYGARSISLSINGCPDVQDALLVRMLEAIRSSNLLSVAAFTLFVALTLNLCGVMGVSCSMPHRVPGSVLLVAKLLYGCGMVFALVGPPSESLTRAEPVLVAYLSLAKCVVLAISLVELYISAVVACDMMSATPQKKEEARDGLSITLE